MRGDNGNGSGAAWARGFAALCAMLAMGLGLMARPAAAAPFAYVTNFGANSVSVIDTATNKVVATVPVGNSPNGVAVTPDGKHAYVTNGADNTVSVIDTATNKVVGTPIPVGIAPGPVAVAPDGRHAYVVNAGAISQSVSVIDTVTNKVVATVVVGRPLVGVAVTPDGERVYVSDDLNVSVIDTATNKVVATVVGAGSQPTSIAITPDGKHGYVTNEFFPGTVSVFATASNTVVARRIPVGGIPRRVAVTPDGKHAYVTDANFKTVSVIATASNTVVATIPMVGGPFGVAITPDGKHAYVTVAIVTSNTGNVSVIDTATNTVVATVPVGSEPGDVAIVPPPPGVTLLCPGNTTGRFFVVSGPPLQADVTIQNKVDGISSISLATAVNCTVTPPLPENFSPPNKGEIPLTATKTDQTKSAQFGFSACPPVGLCCPIDPIFTVLELTTGRWVRQSFAGVPPAEHFVTVTNGDPGLNRLHIKVNSEDFTTLSLRDNETRSLDVAAAMTEKANTISLTGTGELGASASVVIGDTASAPAAKNGGMSAMALAPQGPARRQNAIWGPLAEETEENSDLRVATAASQTVLVNFNGALKSGAAGNPSLYTVEVNGKLAAVQAAHLQAGAAGMDLTLQLPPATLRGGDNVDVSWDNLVDAKGRPLAGHVALVAH
jgi:YVTN family beta-propeller protein